MQHPQCCQTKGFPIAEREAIRPVTANTATKQDLVISANKPTAAFEQRFHSQAGSESGAWAFADEHLRHLPLHASQYDRLRLEAAEVEQLPLLVADERSAILWLRRELGQQPLT